MAWFRPEVTAWIHTELLEAGAMLASTITQTQIAAPPTGGFAGIPGPVQAMVRHGLAPAGSSVPGIPPIVVDAPSYLLDLDLYIDTQQPFDVRTLLGQFQALHARIDSFFRWALTPDGAEQFGLTELEEE